MTIAAPELHPVPVVSPWYHVGIDFIGPLPVSSRGKRYVLTVSDYFTKFVQALELLFGKKTSLERNVLEANWRANG